MPTKATPADLFNLDEWVGRPPLIAVPELIVPGLGGTVTIVLRANDIDDIDWVNAQIKADDSLDENELFMHRMCVAVLKGKVTQDQVDDTAYLPTENIATDPVLTTEQVRKLRKQLYEGQWLVLTTALSNASMTPPVEVTAPSSPRSSRGRGTSAP